jgi:hypothetical protein
MGCGHVDIASHRDTAKVDVYMLGNTGRMQENMYGRHRRSGMRSRACGGGGGSRTNEHSCRSSAQLLHSSRSVTGHAAPATRVAHARVKLPPRPSNTSEDRNVQVHGFSSSCPSPRDWRAPASALLVPPNVRPAIRPPCPGGACD